LHRNNKNFAKNIGYNALYKNNNFKLIS